MHLTINDFETYKRVLAVCVKYKVDVDLNHSDYYDFILSNYTDNNSNVEFERWLSEEIAEHFPAIDERPRWIQNPEWPFFNGAPMLYIGQMEVANQEFFHDVTVFYIFIPKGTWNNKEISVVVQQY